MLVEHRVDDVDERLVAGEHTVPAGEEIALEQPLADVFGQHLDDPPVAVEPVVERSPIEPASPRPVTSRMSLSRLLASSSGAKVKKLSGLSCDHRAATRRAPGSPRARPARARSRRRRTSRQSGSAGRAARAPPLATGLALIRRAPAGTSAAAAGVGLAVTVEQLSGPVRPQPLLEHAPVRRRPDERPAAGTWWARNVPSTCTPSTIGGQVHPFGVRSTIMRPAPASATSRPSRARARISAIASRQRSTAPAMAWCTSAGSSPATMTGS